MFFVAQICKRALRASIEGYLAIVASTPTYSSLTIVIWNFVSSITSSACGDKSDPFKNIAFMFGPFYFMMTV